jgi:hypothetical protein
MDFKVNQSCDKNQLKMARRRIVYAYTVFPENDGTRAFPLYYTLYISLCPLSMCFDFLVPFL